MKNSRFLGFLSALVPALLIFSAQTPIRAAESPQLSILMPAPGANFYWNAPQTIGFELRGGWASQLNSCGELQSFDFGFWGKMTYGLNKSLILHNFGGYAPYSTWDGVLTATGIRCTATINGTDGVGSLFWTAPSPIHTGYEAVFDIGEDEGNVDEVQGNQKVDFGWMIEGKTFSSSVQAQEALVGID